MAFTPEQSERILARVRERTGPEPGTSIRDCPICGHSEWGLQQGGVVFLILQSPDAGGSLVLGGPTLPSVALVCGRCGNTQLLNLLVLGLGDLLKKPEPVEAESEAKQ
jgi:hypothetical protein